MLVDPELAGRLTVVSADDPAADTEVTYTVPAGSKLLVISGLVALVADANAANRRVTIVVDDGTTEVFRSSSGTDQTATQTVNYSIAAVGGGQATVNGSALIPIPLPLVLLPGWRIRTVTANRQAGDNYGVLSLAVIPL